MNSDPAETKIANIPPFGLRMQLGLKRRVEEAAKANGRSLNSEIVARLERSFRENGGEVLTESPLPNIELEKRLSAVETLALAILMDNPLESRVGEIEKRLAELERRFKSP